MILVGLIGYKGSGKNEVANFLTALGFHPEPLAGALKDMLRAIGLTDEHIEGDLKEKPCDLLLGKTPRYAMQMLGTEWGRSLIGEGLWLHLWKSRVKDRDCVVVPDVRFPNEAGLIREMHGKLWKIIRPSISSSDLHESEAHVDQIRPNAEIINDSTLADLRDLAVELGSALLKAELMT